MFQACAYKYSGATQENIPPHKELFSSSYAIFSVTCNFLLWKHPTANSGFQKSWAYLVGFVVGCGGLLPTKYNPYKYGNEVNIAYLLISYYKKNVALSRLILI